jgi:DNA invertase Pin-like site-specific DNA recombinase
MADEAVRLGWARSKVEVIDADLGLSGRSADGRSGFKDLVSRVCLGEVGAIFGLEVSRLARSSADLSRLLELARLTDTLVVDSDGIYDLANFNDRLLLGLKGTMSEAELHFLTGRMNGAKLAAAERGELHVPLPVGLVYDDEGATVIDPDAEVAAAVADVFSAFRSAGSAYGVVATFKGRRFPLRAYGGTWAGELRWGRCARHRWGLHRLDRSRGDRRGHVLPRLARRRGEGGELPPATTATSEHPTETAMAIVPGDPPTTL